MYTSYLKDRLRAPRMDREPRGILKLCEKAADEIERLENDITTFIREAHYAGYMAGVEDSEDYDHDPTEMEKIAFVVYLEKDNEEV